MLQIACFLIGENFKILKNETPASQKKVIAMAIAILIPTFLWVINGLLLSHQILKINSFWSIINSLVCGMIIFIIEKLIIMANGNNWLTALRIAIGIVIGILGSIAIDEVVFKNDIDFSVEGLKQEKISNAINNAGNQYMSQNNYVGLEKEIVSAQNNYDNYEAAVITEVDGTKGSKTKGLGNVAKLKNQKSEQRKSTLNLLKEEKLKLDKGKNYALENARIRMQNSFRDNAILIRIEALQKLIKSDFNMCVVYILFTLLMFFFEFLVVMLKLTWKKTSYELRMQMIEEISNKRIERLLRIDSHLLDPEIYSNQYKSVRNVINTKAGIFNCIN